MWLLLPDEDVSVDDLLTDSEALGFITAKKKRTWENQKQMKVTLSMPKFDISANLDLSNGLKQLGIADCFDVRKADFSTILPDGRDAFVSEIEQRVRVSVDEEGAEGASVTIILDAASAPPPAAAEVAEGFKSHLRNQQKRNFCLPKVPFFVYPSRRLGISSRRSRGYHQPLRGCISSRASVHLPAA